MSTCGFSQISTWPPTGTSSMCDTEVAIAQRESGVGGPPRASHPMEPGSGTVGSARMRRQRVFLASASWSDTRERAKAHEKALREVDLSFSADSLEAMGNAQAGQRPGLSCVWRPASLKSATALSV